MRMAGGDPVKLYFAQPVLSVSADALLPKRAYALPVNDDVVLLNGSVKLPAKAPDALLLESPATNSYPIRPLPNPPSNWPLATTEVSAAGVTTPSVIVPEPRSMTM